MIKWLSKRLQQNPCFLIDCWYWFFLPIVIVTKSVAHDWFGIAMFLLVAAIMYPLRTLVKTMLEAKTSNVEEIRTTIATMSENIRSVNVVLDDENFRLLVAGKQASASGARGSQANVILSDIGWFRMYQAIEDARIEAEEREKGRYKNQHV